MCVKSIIRVNFCYSRAQTVLSEVQSYNPIHPGEVPGPTEIFSTLVRVQHSESAATELLEPSSTRGGCSTTPVLPLPIYSHQSDEREHCIDLTLLFFLEAITYIPDYFRGGTRLSRIYCYRSSGQKLYLPICFLGQSMKYESLSLPGVPGYCYNKLTSLIRLFFKGKHVGRNELMLTELSVVKAKKKKGKVGRLQGNPTSYDRK